MVNFLKIVLLKNTEDCKRNLAEKEKKFRVNVADSWNFLKDGFQC